MNGLAGPGALFAFCRMACQYYSHGILKIESRSHVHPSAFPPPLR
jgi:hypothetical protein